MVSWLLLVSLRHIVPDQTRVKAMGGTLEIASEPGAGMTVTAVIPLAPAERLARLEEMANP